MFRATTAREGSRLRFASAFVCGALAVGMVNGGAYFEPNRGQAAAEIAFVARTGAGTFSVGPSGLGMMRNDGSRSAVGFEGAKARVRPIAERLLPGVSHYALGRDPAQWIWDIPHYGSVRYAGIYRGVDLIYRISEDTVEFDFVLAAGADPSRIRLRVPPGFSIDPLGELRRKGTLLRRPFAWQTSNGKRILVEVQYATDRHRGVYFRVGDYDRRLPLTIDPVVQLATFLGGSGNDIGARVLAGPDGAVYTAGNTTSVDFPASLSPDDLLNRPGLLLEQTAYVARVKADFLALDWSLFIGGSARQAVLGLKLDTFGNLFLLGGTTSPNFPVTAGALHTTIDPSVTDLFVVKFDAQTGHIKASTFLGAALYVNTIDAPASLAIDAAGGIYIGGVAPSGGTFTPTPGALQTSTPAPSFVMRLNAAMTAVVYATYWTIGTVSAMEVDGTGGLWITGTTAGNVQGFTPPFPAIHPLPGVNQSPSWPNQAYIARLNPTGSALISATMLHGDGTGSGISDLKVAPDGGVVLAGWTGGSKFPQVNPLTLPPLPPSYPAQQDMYTASPFLAKLAPDAKSLLQSTLLYGPSFTPPGGQALNTSMRLALQAGGAPCVTGLRMQSADQSPGGLIGTTVTDGSLGYGTLTCVDTTGTTFSVRTGLPPSGNNGVGQYSDVTVTPDGALLFTGSAFLQFVTTPGVFQPILRGYATLTDYYSQTAIPQGDAFLLRLSLNNPKPNIGLSYPSAVIVDHSVSGTCSVALTGSGFSFGASATVNNQPVTYSFADANHATLSFNCGILQAGDNHLVITVPPPGGGTSDWIVAGINSPPYTISISPASVTQGAAETKVVIRATNMTSGSTLNWNGAPRAASFVLDSPQSVTGHFELLLEPPELAQPAGIQVTVSNPAPGGGTSPPTTFAIQPAAGPLVPVLATSTLFYATGAPTQFTLSVSGLTSSTRAFWDGAEVQVISASAGRLTIQPPDGDLARIGAHDIYVSNGPFASLPVRLFVGRPLNAITTAYDPNRKLIYTVSNPSSSDAISDLVIYDATTGNSISTVTAVASSVRKLALSADGQFLYISSDTSPLGTILRYNVVRGSIDLQWTVPPMAGRSTVRIASLATPPGSPETLILSTDGGQVLIYDRNQPRVFDSFSAGIPADYFSGGFSAVFATANRVYANGVTAANSDPCWTWLDFDSFGVSGGQFRCSDDPPEVQHDSGVNYLTDGARFYVTAVPRSLATPNSSNSFAIDITHRRAWQFTGSNFSLGQLVDYEMDTQVFGSKAQFNGGADASAIRLYPVDNGAVLLVTPSYVALIP
jgi:hypothetical protein